MVFELPMRDGNEMEFKEMSLEELVFELPMRDGNAISATINAIRNLSF